jgi:ABC-2 type transport system ATP-binding protein
MEEVPMSGASGVGETAERDRSEGEESRASLIRVEGLGKRFRNVEALASVSLSVPSGSLFLLLGPNGSGKTTFVNLLTGVLRATRGTVRVLGEDPYWAPHLLASRVGVAYEDHRLPPWATAEQYLRFAARARGHHDGAWEAAGRAFGIDKYWKREMGTYSAGMRKRVALAQAWLGNPELLLLDEPFSNLDAGGRLLVADLLHTRSSEGRTTLLATHLAESEAPPTHLAFLLNGRLAVSGSLEELAERYGARSTTFPFESPIEGARLLLAAGVKEVTVADGRLRVRGDRREIETAAEALKGAGLTSEPSEESYDIWSIYRSVLKERSPDSG